MLRILHSLPERFLFSPRGTSLRLGEIWEPELEGHSDQAEIQAEIQCSFGVKSPTFSLTRKAFTLCLGVLVGTPSTSERRGLGGVGEGAKPTRLKLGSRFAMNCAVWRHFGAKEFAQAPLGLQHFGSWAELRASVVTAGFKPLEEDVPIVAAAYHQPCST